MGEVDPGDQPERAASLAVAAEVRTTVATALGVLAKDIDGTQDLLKLGLDSLGLMALLGGWRRAGCTVTFSDLAEDPCLDSWVTALAAAAADGPVAPAAADGPAGEPAPGEDGPFPLATMQHAYWMAGRTGSRSAAWPRISTPNSTVMAWIPAGWPTRSPGCCAAIRNCGPGFFPTAPR